MRRTSRRRGERERAIPAEERVTRSEGWSVLLRLMGSMNIEIRTMLY